MVQVALEPGGPRLAVSALAVLGAAVRHRDEGRHELARFLCAQLLPSGQARVDALIVLLESAVVEQRPLEMKDYCDRLLREGRLPVHATGAVVNALRLLNRYPEAMKVAEKALAAGPTDLGIRHLRAVLLIELNRAEESEVELRRILTMDPQFFPAYRHLAILNRLSPDEIAMLEGHVAEEGRWQGDFDLLFALATAYRHLGDVDREFASLGRAHRALPKDDSWDPGEDDQRTANILQCFDEAFFRREVPARALPCRPIFIVGMPRSGSTLTEQLLATRPGVGDIGETKLFQSSFQEVCRQRFGHRKYLEAVRSFSADDFARVGEIYCERVARIYTDAPVFVDKQLDNYALLGVVRLALPGARILHTVRNPLDTCLSAYQQVFRQTGTPRSLEHLAVKYRNQGIVMSHWKRHFGDWILTVTYEDLVRDPRPHAIAIMEACGLPWSEDVLAFHARDAVVRTASLLQVRRPIYQSSVAKWKRYAKHLAPAMRVIGGSEGLAEGPG